MSPLLRLLTSAANMRQSRSRKSPLSMVPPGNWCEIFSVVAAWAVPVPKRRIAGAATADAMRWRRVSMVYPLLVIVDRQSDRLQPMFAGLRGYFRPTVRDCVIGRDGMRRQVQNTAVRLKA